MKRFIKKHFLYIFFAFLLIVPLMGNGIQAQGWDSRDPQYRQNNDDALDNGALGLPSTITNVNAITKADWLCEIIGGATCSKKYASRFSNYGLIPQIEQVNLAMMMNQPADLKLWIADTGRSLGFIPNQAYAQGVGFNGFAPLLNVWKAFRNISYVLISLSIVVVAFMIMFRRKIDPQTVVTIQEALPRIIVTLILITFSYAIAGLLIDLLYVVLLVSHSILLTAGLPTTRDSTFLGIQNINGAYNTRDSFTTGNLLQAVGTIFPNGMGDFSTLFFKITGIAADRVGAFAGGTAGVLAGASLLGPFAILTGALGALGGAAVGALLVQLLIAILVAILVIRLFFLFVGAYIQIVLYVLFGPLMILPEIFPGSAAFSSWIKNIVGNLAVFAIAGVMFMIATVFAVNVDPATGPGAGNPAVWSPPFLFLINPTSGGLAALFTIGILTLIPTLATQGKQMIVGKEGGIAAMGGAILSPIGPAAGTIMQLATFVQSRQSNKILRERLKPPGSTIPGADGGGGGAAPPKHP